MQEHDGVHEDEGDGGMVGQGSGFCRLLAVDAVE
jgi:hypothetical protein